MSEELWHFIPEYDKAYAVSDHGRVLNVSRQSALRPSSSENGYLKLTLHRQGIRTYFTVHRLVAAAFMDDFNPKFQVEHRDGDKTNNRANNLHQTNRVVRSRE